MFRVSFRRGGSIHEACPIATLMEKYHQKVKVVASRDFRFVHIDAGQNLAGMQRIVTETSEESVLHCFLYPVITDYVQKAFPELNGVALTIHIEWV